MRLLAAFVASLLVTSVAAAAPSFTEEFDEGWEQRWTAASDAKYKGRFVVDTFTPDVALKVPLTPPLTLSPRHDAPGECRSPRRQRTMD